MSSIRAPFPRLRPCPGPSSARPSEGAVRPGQATCGPRCGARRRQRARSGPSTGETGSVTAELAVLLPGVVLTLVVILVAASAGVAQVRCADAARAGARAASLGQSSQEVHHTAEELAGEGARVSVDESGRWVRVRVAVDVPLGPLSGVLTADASFAALVEPSGAHPLGPGPAVSTGAQAPVTDAFGAS